MGIKGGDERYSVGECQQRIQDRKSLCSTQRTNNNISPPLSQCHQPVIQQSFKEGTSVRKHEKQQKHSDTHICHWVEWVANQEVPNQGSMGRHYTIGYFYGFCVRSC